VDIIPAVAPLYMVLTPVRVLTYYILTTILYRRISVGHAAVPPPYYVYIPIRVGIHICVYTQETGVAYQTELLQKPTPTLYIQIYYRPPIKGVFFPFDTNFSKIQKWQLSFFKTFWRRGKYV
jgi:hypothetical protein